MPARPKGIRPHARQAEMRPMRTPERYGAEPSAASDRRASRTSAAVASGVSGGGRGDLDALREAARHCHACPLWKPATQTVFGHGPADAVIMLIGEQPGDREDLTGLPFVGPAGRLLDKALSEVGADRRQCYLTNVVKHFKFELRGKRRLHQRARAAEINACLRWLNAELEQLAPRYVVCLGTMAARVILGTKFRLQAQRGRWMKLGGERWCLATVHPSFVLRSRAGTGYEATYATFVDDLRALRDLPDGNGAEATMAHVLHH